MNVYFKPTIILSLLLGGILGLVMLIPFINSLGCFLLFTLVGGAIVYYMKKNAFVGILSVQDGAIIGGISGFVSLWATAIVFLPLRMVIDWILSLFFHHMVKTGMSIISSMIVASYSFFIILVLVFFVALMSALFNSFSGLVMAYIFEKLENASVNKDDHFIIEQ